MSNSSSTYYKYLTELRENNELQKIKDFRYYLKGFNLLKNIISLLPCTVFVLDFSTGEYLSLSENWHSLSGYTIEEYVRNGGLKFSHSRYHPDDLNVIAHHVFAQFLDYAKTMQEEELKTTRFSFNLRYRKKDGIFMKALQQFVVLNRDPQNNPLLVLGICTDITAHKLDNNITFSISKHGNQGSTVTFLPGKTLNKNMNISPRQIEIAKLILQGHNSNQIAERLKLSPYTVRAHRRNLLEKTRCRNTAELSRYVISSGLI